MDYSEIGRKGANKFWNKFYTDERFREMILEKWKHQNKDPIKSHNAAKIAANARWEKYRKNKIEIEKEKVIIPEDTEENIILKYRLCGYLTGDGSLNIRSEKANPKRVHSDVRFYPDDEEMLKAFLEAFTKLYNKRPKIIQDGYFFRLHKSSKIICRDLLRFTKFGSLEWKVPTLKINLEAKKEWLKAFFDCEAYVNEKTINLQSVNGQGLREVQRLLLEFSIESKIYEYSRKNKRWNKNYILVISKKESRLLFLNKVGFNHSKKRYKLEMCFAGIA